jgi:hypothetical protein
VERTPPSAAFDLGVALILRQRQRDCFDSKAKAKEKTTAANGESANTKLAPANRLKTVGIKIVVPHLVEEKN